MGIRFTSFEAYKSMLAKTDFAKSETSDLTNQGTFLGTIANPMDWLNFLLIGSA